MDKIIRPGVTRRDLTHILALSERPEEVQNAELYVDRLGLRPEYDPDAIGLFIDGKAMAAGGLLNVAPGVVMFWIISAVDLGEYRFPLMRHARRLMKQAREKGLRVVSAIPTTIERAKNPSVHLGLKPARELQPGITLYA